MNSRRTVVIASCGLLIVVILSFWFLRKSHGKDVPATDEVTSKLQSALPAYIELVDCRVECSQLPGDKVEARFRAKCRARVDLFEIVSDSLQPGCRLVSRVREEGDEWDLFGSISAIRYVDQWQFAQPQIQSGLRQIGRPREEFPGAILSGSSEDLPASPGTILIEQGKGEGVAVLSLSWGYDLQAAPNTRFTIERMSGGEGQWALLRQGISDASFVDSLYCNGGYAYRLFAVQDGCRSQGIISAAFEVQMNLAEWLEGYWSDIDVNNFQNGNFTLHGDSGVLRFPNAGHPSDKRSILAELQIDSSGDTTVSFVRIKDGAHHQQYVGQLETYEDSIVIIGDPQNSKGINYVGTLNWRARKP